MAENTPLTAAKSHEVDPDAPSLIVERNRGTVEVEEQRPEKLEGGVVPGMIKHLVLSGGGVTGFTFYGILRETHRDGLWKLEKH
jgi:hypothetical protein